jgi:ABC-type nitrate/sulfonate/bicarbonate transport system substrate-binding protein
MPSNSHQPQRHPQAESDAQSLLAARVDQYLSRRGFLATAGGFTAATILAACGSSSKSGGPSASSAGATNASSKQDSVSLVLDYLPNTDDIWVYVGLQQGYYAAHGIDLKVTVPTNFAATAELVGLGKFDLGLGAGGIGLLDPLLKGVPVVSIATTMAKDTAGVISLPKENINGPKDLIGKTFAMPNDPGSVADFKQFMKFDGYSVDQVKVEYVNFSPPYILSGKANAGLGVDWGEGVVVQATAHVKPVIQYFTDYGVPDNQGNIVFTSEKYAKANGDILERFLLASALSIKRLLTDSKAASRAEEVASTGPNKLGTLQQNLASLEASRHAWFDNGTLDAANATYLTQNVSYWEAAYKWAVEIGYAKSYYDPSKVVTNRYITSAASNPQL